MGIKNGQIICKFVKGFGLGVAIASIPVLMLRTNINAREASKKKNDLLFKLNEIKAEESYREHWENEKKALIEDVYNGKISSQEYAKALREINTEESYWDFICNNSDPKYAPYAEEYNNILVDSEGAQKQAGAFCAIGMGGAVVAYVASKIDKKLGKKKLKSHECDLVEFGPSNDDDQYTIF